MQQKKILIVEDNMEIARMYERAFRLNGFETVVVHDGEDALKALEASQELPAAIVLDVVMPHMNGLDFILHVRAQERYKAVPIAVLTNSFGKEDADRFLSEGADLYLVEIDTGASEVVEKVQELITHNGRQE